MRWKFKYEDVVSFPHRAQSHALWLTVYSVYHTCRICDGLGGRTLAEFGWRVSVLGPCFFRGMLQLLYANRVTEIQNIHNRAKPGNFCPFIEHLTAEKLPALAVLPLSPITR